MSWSQTLCCLPRKSDCSSREHFQIGRLPTVWREQLAGGQLLTALILSVLYSEKYRGRSMQPGESAEVQLPARQAGEARHPKLLHRIGSREISAFAWLGDEPEDGRIIYLAFNPLRKKRQFLKLLWAGACSVERTTLSGRSEADAGAQTPRSICMLSYVKRKLNNLWTKFGFDRQLQELAASYPEHKFLFAGLSHGAAMAQAAAFRLRLEYPEIPVKAVTWNAYKWTDENGSALVHSVMGDCLLPIVLSRQGNGEPRRWDSVAGAPASLAAMQRVLLLDADTGIFMPCQDVGNARVGLSSAMQAMELHFAKVALKAMRIATVAALEDRAGHMPISRLRSFSSLSWTTSFNETSSDSSMHMPVMDPSSDEDDLSRPHSAADIEACCAELSSDDDEAKPPKQ
eukprot:gnl/TRDRNA2_/TRDRNA2_149119_c0_seq4.p1 gnl/TRDRNA2_/TRDRNA2_149119_c0~~gnl/TRDRNA2_/TRDRNA2_149119_c0_seq4.p1  ORF type:complete len:400 (+),score=61.63 gnl/TRDRNA2_/TRDRNA2_149119_c0_seq4:65-1264(+)